MTITNEDTATILNVSDWINHNVECKDCDYYKELLEEVATNNLSRDDVVSKLSDVCAWLKRNKLSKTSTEARELSDVLFYIRESWDCSPITGLGY